MEFKNIGRKLIEKFPELTDSLSKLNNDANFQKTLSQAGSIGSLFGIGIILFTEIKKNLSTTDQRAFAALLKIMLESADRNWPKGNEIAIKEIAKSKEDFINELFDKFIETANTNSFPSYLPNHPIIEQFRERVCNIIRNVQEKEQKNLSSDSSIQNFYLAFNKTITEKIENEAKNDYDLNNLLNKSKDSKITKKLVDYLVYASSLQIEPRSIDNKYLKEIYIPNRIIEVNNKKDWSLKDSDIVKKYYEQEEWNIEEFFNNDNEWLRVIAASYGVGKTSFTTYMTSSYASNYLNNPNSLKNFIPIYVPLRRGLKGNRIYGQLDIESLLSLISLGTGGDKYSSNANILVFLDGLDEYTENVKDLIEFIDKKHHEHFPNIKFIITTRMESSFLQQLPINKYIRLLPFDAKQVESLLQKYNLQYKFDEIKEKIDEWEIRKPLLCWIFANIHNTTKIPEKIIKNRTVLYFEFIHSVIIGKYKEDAKEYNIEMYNVREKKIIRKIAALRQIYKGGLSRKILDRKLREFDLELENWRYYDNILMTYFHRKQPIKNQDDELGVDFVHGSFENYMLAEYYIESILEKKAHRLNVRLPKPLTIEFLNGLLELLLEKDDEKIKYFVYKEESGLLKSFGDEYGDQKTVLEEIKNFCWEIIKKEDIVFFNLYDDSGTNVNNTNTTENTWKRAYIGNDDYSDLIIHKWIALYIYNKIYPEKKDLDERMRVIINNIIMYSSNLIPYHLKCLTGMDLKGTDLTQITFTQADLRGANLSLAIIRGANLSDANLSGADLSGADLSGSNMTRTILSGHTDLSGAILQGAKLSGAILPEADLSGTDMTNAILKGANLSGADLTGADLTGADLTGADLTGANLSSSILIGANFCDIANLPILEDEARVRGAILVK